MSITRINMTEIIIEIKINAKEKNKISSRVLKNLKAI